MARVHRIDVTGTLARPVRRADGTMVVEARLARTGLYEYSNPDGSTRVELRTDEHVFAPTSVDTFRLVPLTLGHPPEMVTSENAKKYSVGAVGENIRRDGDWMVATLAVHDAAAIRALNSGVTQVSNGYDCELVMTPGTTADGRHYDAVQTCIVGNHVAIVPNARAGKDAAVRMDAAIFDHTDGSKEHIMDLTQALVALAAANEKIGALTARADAADQSVKTLKERADKLEAERDAAKEAAFKADSARKDAVDGQDARVQARVDLVDGARRVLGARCDATGDLNLRKMNDRDIKLAVIKQITNTDCSVDAAGVARTDVYVDARYDAAIERAVGATEAHRTIANVIAAGRADTSTGSRRDSAREQMIAANRGELPSTTNSAK